eukprot:COSAG01_NODE_38396_length_490_cov_0.831202_1_plen_44_part_10
MSATLRASRQLPSAFTRVIPSVVLGPEASGWIQMRCRRLRQGFV